MLSLLIVFFSSSVSIMPSLAVENRPITKLKDVEKLCYQASRDILEEQGIKVNKWQPQSFNGDRTFNVEGKLFTNGGLFLVECELPFGSNKSVLAVQLYKSS